MKAPLRPRAVWSATQLFRPLLISVVVMAAAETLVMLLIGYLPPVPVWAAALIDAFALSALALPLLYLFVFRPVATGTARREHAEQALDESESYLRQAEEKYRDLFEHAPNAIYQTAPDGTILTANDAMARTLGYESAAELSQKTTDVSVCYASPEDRVEFRRRLDRDGVVRNFECEIVCRDGSRRWVSDDARIVRNTGGGIQYFEGTLRDITERMQAQGALVQSESRYRLLFANLVSGFAYCRMRYDDQGRPADFLYLDVNQAFVQLTGLSDVVGKWVSDVIPGIREVSPEVFEIYGRVASTGNPEVFEFDFKSNAQWLTISAYSPEPGHFVAIFDDITVRKRKEYELRLFRAQIDHSSDAIQVVDPETMRFVDVNDRACRDLGYSREELLALRMPDIDPEFGSAGHATIDADLLRTGSALFETTHRRKDGSTFPVEVNLAQVTFDRGFVIVVARDITTRKSVEAAVRLRGEALNAAANAIVITDCDGKIEWVNAALMATTGYEASEVIGKNPGELFKSGVHDRAFYKSLWDTLLAGEVWRGEMVNRRKDGSLYTEEVTITPISDAHGGCAHFIAIKTDISDRKRDEEQLREQAELLDLAQDAIVVRDLEHRITYWNKSAERLYGWTAADAVGRSVPDVFYKDPAVFYETHDSVCRTGEWTGELQQLRADGRELWVESRWTLIRDRSGAPKSVLVINTDITERKLLEKQFLRAQRLESIGTLAGGIAHDLNNVLTPIILSIDLLKMRVDDADSRSLIENISTSAQRGADMVGQVLSFARGLEGRRVDVQARHLIREMEKIARETFPKNVRVSSLAGPDLWTVAADPTQLHQVLLNLCINARDAMPDGGQLTISAKNTTFNEQDAARNIEAHVGRYVVIEVKDTGTGIPQSIIEKIFNPFFTTKDVGKGTGLGLSTSLNIVQQHGGFVRVASEAGVGTEFRVYLPAAGDGRTEAPHADAAELPRGGGETVLVVDDESAIREITRQTLEAFGYRVLLASDGSQAVSLYAQHADDIAVVVIDIMMPVMDGAAAIQVLAKMNPAVRIIVISGRAEAAQMIPQAGTTAIRFLPKPLSAETLLQALRAMRPAPPEANLRLFE